MINHLLYNLFCPSVFSAFFIQRHQFLEETEKIEHIVTEETLKCISRYVNFLKDNPEIKKLFENY